MTYQHLLVKHEGPISTITLNRPEKRNALAVDVMVELTATLPRGRCHRCPSG